MFVGRMTICGVSCPPCSLTWPTAQPGETLDYSLSLTPVLLGTSDTVTSASVSVAPSGDGELTASDLTVTVPTVTTIASGTYDSDTGAVALTTVLPHGLGPGDTFTLAGITGTGSYASLDGTYVAGAGTTGFTLNLVAAPDLTLTITGGNVNYGALLTVWLSGGVASRTYLIMILAGTAQGREFEYLVNLLISAVTAPYPVTDPPNLGYSTPIVWP